MTSHVIAHARQTYGAALYAGELVLWVDAAERIRGCLTPRVSGGAVCRPLDPLVMRTLEVVP